MPGATSRSNPLSVPYEQLRAEQERLKAIVAAVGEGFVVLDKKQRVLYMNKVAGKLLGLDPQTARGRLYPALAKLEDKSGMPVSKNRPLRLVLKDGKTRTEDLTSDLYYVLPSGRRFPVAFTDAPLLDRKRNIIGAVTVFRDITEQKKLDEAKTGFISTASHQLRTPLTAIRWYTELLFESQRAAPPAPEQQEFAKQIYAGVLRLVNMLNILLSLTKVETGQITVKPKTLNLLAFTKDILKELAPTIETKQLTITIDAKNVRLLVRLDPLILRQVVSNLLGNAIAYSYVGGSVVVEFRKMRDEVIYTIKDQGIGVPKRQQKKIFSRFFRGTNAIRHAPGGTGLGLVLVKSLIELWGGRIWLTSPVPWIIDGKKRLCGSAFSFTIKTG